jgi:5-methylcytosine-specific restriction endonuclease McrBC regulatory subunit McrC
MNEQQVNALIAALKNRPQHREQTDAINRLAESNMALCDVIIQSLAGDLDEQTRAANISRAGNPG